EPNHRFVTLHPPETLISHRFPLPFLCIGLKLIKIPNPKLDTHKPFASRVTAATLKLPAKSLLSSSIVSTLQAIPKVPNPKSPILEMANVPGSESVVESSAASPATNDHDAVGMDVDPPTLPMPPPTS
ncbi:hypothetical protein Tsubulata_001437, partial [Turnera subulata]